jgi:hypothetical protein
MPLSKSVPFPTEPAGAGERGFAFLEGKGGFISPKPTSPWMAATAILGAPGLYNDSQIIGWKQVTDAVHAKGGTIFLQLYHAGRQSNSQLQPGGGAPVGPSEVLHGGVDGDDRRHAVRSLVGHGGSHRANHMSQPRMPAPTGIAARHILALQLATPVSEALQR